MPEIAVAVIVTPGFSPFHLSIPSIIFGHERYAAGRFSLRLCAEVAGQIASDSGFSVHTEYGLEALADADMIIVPYWPDPDQLPSQLMQDALRRAHQRGAMVVGLCLGTYVLAYSGLLDGHKAATHWEYEADFCHRFPTVQLDTYALYVEDGGLVTSAGTAAALDCCLHLVRRYYGSQVANGIARSMVIPPYREGGQAQFIERPIPVTSRDSHINALLDYLRRNLQQAHTIDSLAEHVCMSRRTFTRHFLRATGMSVNDWLNSERLQFSQRLLESTGHSIEIIAGMAGFNSAVTYRQQFKKQFQVSPQDWRRTFQGREHSIDG
ncbi:GlxA family transcriptional regulator [Gynuella sunshinyii]|uniref:Transcriptional regulator containing an amidase domain and an AraC-type DNA-binding HTH domain n=1 Tax=Gynuella sunshinyii YC6258 TaxID=1445510 RepID=A0A0C5W4C7_9GAMM|nr:helix-turn-helix domain-containing protein [Gynuella sunshinyii]AJQ97479.1 transcriptional regulator containing an amidase domain and an AraC-type DNA-binding HTH domain [Gynuella sunshinyii YC6258]